LREKVPLEVVVVVENIVINLIESFYFAPKLVPLTLTSDVGGPDVGESVMCALAARTTGVVTRSRARQTTKTRKLRGKCRGIRGLQSVKRVEIMMLRDE